MREQLKKEIEKILEELGVENPKVPFDYPARMNFGDLSTNVAMAYAKQLGKNPLGLAEQIKEKLEKKSLAHVQDIEAVAPGFINFYFDPKYFSENVFETTINEIWKGQKMMVEFTDPNPFKEFHIGHFMSNTIGESVSRILSANGAEIKRANYQGDVGLHVAKALYIPISFLEFVRKDRGQNTKIEEFQFAWDTLRNGGDYTNGNKEYDSNDEAKQKIQIINKKIYDKSDSDINYLYERGRKESLDYFEGIYKKLGTKFDLYFFESEVAAFGKETVEKKIGEVFEKSDGAIIFPGEKYGLHTRVFINSQGLPTYEAKELGLNKKKFEVEPDLAKSVIVTGNEIQEYFKVLLKAISIIFPEIAEKTKHLPHGMLRLPEGKMSSRTGNVITAEFLIDGVKKAVIEKMKEREMSAEQMEIVAEIIAIGAIKFSILHQAIGGDIIFDFDKSISFEGDSGPYLQYATVRANSLLKKAEGVVGMSQTLPENWQTTDLERKLERFPGVVEKAGKEYAPHHIVTYLTELAGEFNSFYANHKIIDTEDKTSSYRLALTKAFAGVMTRGLDLLGIKVPEQM